MRKLTKNFNFIDDLLHPSLFKYVVEIEERFINKDYSPMPNLAGKIVELVFIEKFNQPERQGMSYYINWYKDTYAHPIVVDALFTIKRFRNDGSHAVSDGEEMSWTNALWIIKSVSIILQEVFQEKPLYTFSEVPYLTPNQQLNNFKEKRVEIPMSVNDSELAIEKTSLVKWLKNDNIVFKIPYYQRLYTWRESQIETLIDDIKLRIKDRFQHYFGVVAIKKELIKQTDNVAYKIIDGQQRLTTSILLYKAAFDNLKNRGLKSIQILDEIFSVNIGKLAETRYTNDSANDGAKKELKEILTKNLGLSRKFEWRYGKNYEIFYKYFNECDYSFIYDFINAFATKFEIARLEYDIEPEREMDIFENMNSKGTELEEWDLIRNHLLNITDREVADNIKVRLMEDHFLHDFNSGLGDSPSKILQEFFTEYFYYEASFNDEIKWISDERFPVYNNFKRLLIGKKLSAEDYKKLLNKFWSFGQIHKSLEMQDFSVLGIKNASILTRLKDISKKQQLYFLVYKIFDQTSEWTGKKWIINNEKLLGDLIKTIHNVVLRLEIARGFGTSFRNFAITLSRYLNDENALEKIKDVIEASSQIYIKDFELTQKLITSPLKTELAKTLLMLMNDFLLDEEQMGVKITFTKPELEHVMPRNNEKWEQFLISQNKNSWKVEFDRTLNLIGNFYVLPKKLNIKISNSIFDEKKVELLKIGTPEIVGSPKYKITSLKDVNSWTFKAIDERTTKIANLLVKYIISI